MSIYQPLFDKGPKFIHFKIHPKANKNDSNNNIPFNFTNTDNKTFAVHCRSRYVRVVCMYLWAKGIKQIVLC